MLHRFFDATLTGIKESSGCKCKSGTNQIEKHKVLTHIPDYVFIEVSPLNYSVTPTISQTSSKNTQSKKSKSKQNKSVTFNIEEDKEIMNMKIDPMYTRSINGKSYTFKLQSIVLLENRDHFTLAFNTPTFNEKIYPDWIYYNDINATIQKWTNEDLDLSNLLENDRVPLILGYKKIRVLPEK